MARLVVDVLQEVRQRYVRELKPEEQRQFVEAMINGGLERLDPHSNYINPQDFKQFSRVSKGTFGGVGISLGVDMQKGGRLTVLSPIVGTPAYAAGILAGDIITKINGKVTENLGISEAIDLIQGDPGSEVTLTVMHEGEKKPVDYTLKRDIIRVQSVIGDTRKPDGTPEFMLNNPDKIAYLRIATFSETTVGELRTALAAIQAAGARGLVIDVRYNPGGLLAAAVEICDMFLDDGVIVSTRGRNQQDLVYSAHREGTLFLPAKEFPIAILVNRYSASASEILAAALQDHGRAVIIGERSYGKGSVQNVIPMESQSSALKLTTASYWRPSGKNIHRFPDSKETDEWGVTPNPEMEVKLEDKERVDYQRWRGDRDVVREVGKPHTPLLPDFKDRVLEKALQTLRAAMPANPPQ
jgi:carboxyl-terminal processing protease